MTLFIRLTVLVAAICATPAVSLANKIIGNG